LDNILKMQELRTCPLAPNPSVSLRAGLGGNPGQFPPRLVLSLSKGLGGWGASI